MKVAACLIVFDEDPEHKKLSDLFTSTEDAKTSFYVVGVDRKSVSGTEEWIRDFIGPDRCDVYPFTFEDDFAAARQQTLSRVPEDCEFWYWIDSDDTLQSVSGKSVVEFCESIPADVSAVFCNYDYDKDAYGNSTTILTRGRFYRSSVPWEWRGRVHEDVYPPTGKDWPELGLARSDDFLWVHNTEGRTSAGERNFRLLEKAINENPEDARNWYYLGNQHFAVHNWQQAVAAFDRYLSLSNWTEQKWDALIRQAIAYRSLGLLDEAIVADTKAMLLLPKWADSYFGLGESYTRKEDWDKAVHFGELGLQRVASGDGIPDPVVFINTNAYDHNPYRWLAVAYFNRGENDKALAALERAAKSRPEPELLRQISHMKWAMGRRRLIEQALNLAAGLMRRNEPLKAKAILENLPAGAMDETPDAQVALQEVSRRVAHLYDKAAYKNLYYEEAESIDPVAVLKNADWAYPRMAWVVRRLKAAGVKRVLDMGVGNAVSSFMYAKAGIQVVGIDVDVRRVRDANWNAVKLGLLSTKEVGLDEEDDEKVTVPDISYDSPVQFHYCDADELSDKVLELGPYDAVVCAEVIEHVKDPEHLLEQCERAAKRVIITTPDGSYDGPQEHNPSHVFVWSQRELARLIVPRGKVVSLHKVDHPTPGEQGNIMVEYLVGESVSGPPVTIWCPDTGQDWTPDSIREGGIGGSETAVIRVAEELANLGKRVTVYAECEGIWNGVRYALTKDFRPIPCETFVAWRTYGPTDAMKGIAEKRYIWAHDIHVGPLGPMDGVQILALSRWHKTFLEKQYPGAEVVLSSNGIDPSRFDKEVERRRYRLIYAQSPDRGLDVLLDLFPKIRARYPSAELHVYYGFDMARERNPQFIASIEEKAQQPGVFLHGRVDQERLAEEYLRSDVLLYPATMPDGNPFHETYCISIVEAQAAGCVPITPAHGGLDDTNATGIKVYDAEPQDLLDALFDFWTLSRRQQDEYRQMGHLWATDQTWARVASEWVREPVPA